MSIYAISDLHLALSIKDKPMDVFGQKWENYIDRLCENWQNTVKVDDLVLICGDVSWATYIKDCYEDFSFIEKLNGKKIISKGNHDYWWETLNKLNAFLNEHDFKTIRFLHNNIFIFENTAICGAKGYTNIEEYDIVSDEDKKIYDRELIRLELSLELAKKAQCENIIAMLHYPPGKNSSFMELLNKYNVNHCIYGHLHGPSHRFAVEENMGGTKLKCVSADFLEFKPYKII